MRALTFLRSSYGVRLLPIVLVVGLLIGRAHPLVTDQTPISTSGRRLAFFMLVGGLVAMGAALEARRYHSGGVLDLPSVRSRLLVLAPALGAVVLPAMVVGAVLVAVQGSGRMGWAVALVGLVWMAAWALLGALLGLTTRAVVAVPVGLLAPILAVAYAPALEVLWLRYVIGFYEDCCSISESLDPRAIIVGLVGAASVAFTCGVAILLRIAKRWPASAVWPVTLMGLTLTLVLVSPVGSQLDARPVVPRTGPQRCVGKVPICLWPEQRDKTSIVASATAVLAAWHSQGVDVPMTVVQGSQESSPDRLSWAVPHDHSEQAIAWSLSSSMAFAPCQSGTLHQPTELIVQQQRASAWLALHSGVQHIPADWIDPGARQWVHQLPGTPLQQSAQVNALLTRVRSCR